MELIALRKKIVESLEHDAMKQKIFLNIFGFSEDEIKGNISAEYLLQFEEAYEIVAKLLPQLNERDRKEELRLIVASDIKKETDKAVLFTFVQANRCGCLHPEKTQLGALKGPEVKVWLPKSRIAFTRMQCGEIAVLMPKWLLQAKNSGMAYNVIRVYR